MKHKLNTDRIRDISNHDALQRVLNVGRSNNAKNDNVVLHKVQMYNAY